MGRKGAYKNSIHLYEHGMCVMIESRDSMNIKIETLKDGITSVILRKLSETTNERGTKKKEKLGMGAP